MKDKFEAPTTAAVEAAASMPADTDFGAVTTPDVTPSSDSERSPVVVFDPSTYSVPRRPFVGTLGSFASFATQYRETGSLDTSQRQ